MSDARVLWLLLALGLGGGLLYLLAPVLTPFLIAALLAYVFNPLVTRLERWRWPRTLSVVLLFVLLLVALILLGLWLIPRSVQQLGAFAARLPGYLETLREHGLPWLESVFGGAVAIDFDTLKQQAIEHGRGLAATAAGMLADLGRSGMKLATVVVNLVLVPVVLFYLLRDWNDLVARVPGLFPAAWRPRLARLARETDEVLGAFLRGQLLVMLALAAIYSSGLLLVGLDLALPIGIAAGLVSFVPYLGFIVGIAAAGAAAYVQFHDPLVLAGVAAVFAVGQVIESALLTPNLVGDRIGLHPVAVIFAILAGGQLFGFFGVLLALPAAAAIAVWLRHLHRGLIGPPPRRARSRP
jgi:predicted PurR-regulated permease PerM